MSKWDGKSRGTVVGYKIFLFFIRVLGVKAAYAILYFVSNYYFLFAGKHRESIIRFYTQTLGYSKKDAIRICRKNFFIFGQTLIDRAAFLVGKGDSFTFSFENETVLHQLKQNGKGGLLLSAHVGNWETAGNLLRKRVSADINVVMLDAEIEQIKKLLEGHTGGSRFKMIPIKDDMSHVIRIHNALANNELVAMHADRFLEGAKNLELEFFGRKAKFPLGPFLIASKFDAPVSFVFAMKGKNFHYSLSATLPITGKLQPQEIAKLYILELEKKVRQYPDQWFNYFEFFSHAN